jgi:hypothetical protein
MLTTCCIELECKMGSQQQGAKFSTRLFPEVVMGDHSDMPIFRFTEYTGFLTRATYYRCTYGAQRQEHHQAQYYSSRSTPQRTNR